MSDEMYHKLAKVLDTLPNGFPSTDTGVEIKILKKIFTPEEAEVFCDLKMHFESADEIASRTGRSFEGLEAMLDRMLERGEIFRLEKDGRKAYKMAPWVVGIYEFQLDRMDKEFAKLNKEYVQYMGPEMIKHSPGFLQVVPIEKEIPTAQQALPYHRVSTIIENGKRFFINECICKKEMGLLDRPCSYPTEICMAIDPDTETVGSHNLIGREITREEAYEVLNKAEEAGLVHLTGNTQTDHWFICNCCGCCCGALQAVRYLGLTDIVNSHYYAEIDPDLCTACGTCKDERCQVKAIDEEDDVYRINERCIGCGLCVTSCPTEAIRLIHKNPEEIQAPPKDVEAWNEERARQRGVDFSAYK